MHYLELKAKVKSGKENELNQVIKDLVPNFQAITDLKTQVDFNEEEGELNIRISNGGSSQKIKEMMENQNFVLFLGSIKVLCSGYTLIFPNNKD
jgi:hypothetical protein